MRPARGMGILPMSARRPTLTSKLTFTGWEARATGHIATGPRAGPGLQFSQGFALTCTPLRQAVPTLGNAAQAGLDAPGSATASAGVTWETGSAKVAA